MAQIVTGLDIGSDSVKLVQVKHGRGDSFKVLAYGMVEVTAASDELGAGNPVADAIKKLLVQCKISPTHLVSAIPKQSVVVRYLALPTNSVSEVQQMLRFEASKYVPFYTDNDIVDFELLGSSHLGGSELLMAVCRREQVEEHLNLLKSVHLEPYSLDCNSLALIRGLRRVYPAKFKEPNKNYLVLDFGYASLDMSLVQNGSLKYNRSTNVSGGLLQKLLRESLDITEVEARKLIDKIDLLKEDYGITEYNRDDLSDAINTWQQRIENEIKRSLDYFGSEFTISQMHGIFLSGGLSRIKSLGEYLEKELGLPVTSAACVTENGKALPELNSAFGLAMRKVTADLGVAVNLLPPEILRKRVKNQRYQWVALAGVAVLALIGFGVYSGFQKYNSMVNSINQIDRELLRDRPKAADLEEIKKQLDAIRKMVNQKDVGIQTLSSLSNLNTIPTRVALEKFVYERNRTITITAVTRTLEEAVNFRYEVERIGLFEQVSLQSQNPDTMEGQPVIRFQVVAKIRPDKSDITATEANASKQSDSGEEY